MVRTNEIKVREKVKGRVMNRIKATGGIKAFCDYVDNARCEYPNRIVSLREGLNTVLTSGGVWFDSYYDMEQYCKKLGFAESTIKRYRYDRKYYGAEALYMYLMTNEMEPIYKAYRAKHPSEILARWKARRV